jgi:small-conductance mechanosensitive channel
MTRIPILQQGQSYTFRQYFELPFEPDDVLAELGYSLDRAELNLVQHSGELDRLEESQRRIRENLQYVSLTSEQARRELLVAPIITDLCYYTHSQLRIEYPLVVSDWLKGNLDYFVRANNTLLVVEAKNDDLARGFTQLGAELVALDRWTDSEQSILYGAVTTGDIWKLGQLYRSEKRIVQDINLYRVPGDFEDLMRILVAILA